MWSSLWLPLSLLTRGPWLRFAQTNVALFYRIYDAAGGRPTGEELQKGYIDAGSEGVRQFIPHRIISGAALAAAIIKHHADYEGARKCLAALPAVKVLLEGALRRLSQLDPDAQFPPVTVLVGRDNSGGTTGKSGVLIGLEVACRTTWDQPDPRDLLYHLIAHEYGHVEQASYGGQPTLLRQALVEGGAELVAELISGEVSNIHLQRWTKGRERQIDHAFLSQMDSKDLSAWLYNGVGTPQKPGDLGYWVGYRIAKAYYQHATDKRAALAAVLALHDPRAILARSGWKPGDPD